ncbi:TIGR03936 family radical SAM-associated protein [Chloroflexota bacterium]
MQRLRLRFSRGKEIRFISHLDIVRLWQRACHRAGIPLAYTEGFSPHPRISLAAPLPLGVTSEAELMDIFSSKWITPHFFTAAVGRQLPPGIAILQANQIPPAMPSLQSQVGHAEYTVTISTDKEPLDLEQSISQLLSLEHLPWQHQRDTGTRNYDLRALIDDIWLIECQPPNGTIGMRLRCDSNGSGRAEQVIAALGLGRPVAIHRSKFIMKGKRPAPARNRGTGLK